ncbi:MAG: carbohydrate ABC transporter permease [Clostridia bacterium]|nr:carbohydrate ABC transporter permease [Clostridia bacterium]
MIKKKTNVVIYALLFLLSAIFLFPVVLVLINAFKSKFYISTEPFRIPTGELFVGLENFRRGLSSVGFFAAVGRSVIITVLSVVVIVLLCAMCAWFLVRTPSRFSRILYGAFVFSMVVPFPMIMYTATYLIDRVHLANVLGMIPVYLGFGAGLSIFLYTAFIKTLPAALEEAAQIDGAGVLATFFRIVFPLLSPTAITVAILNGMWIWNDYLLPYLVLGNREKTIPVAIELSMQGAFGSVDLGGLMAMLILAILPILFFYLFAQRYVIEGITSGSVKG